MTSLLTALRAHATSERAVVSQRFFKTGKGEYGEGDVFMGVTVPDMRTVARQFVHLSLREVEKHLTSKIHEERLVALLILVEQFKKTDTQKEIYDFYLKNRAYVNNWDLVDSSADKIVGVYLRDKDTRILYDLARADSVWDRRIAIVATFDFIKHNRFDETFAIADMLMHDTHDLIHKATGWMLREVGKRDMVALEMFLKKYQTRMPRTMLRYAIERFPEKKRSLYMRGVA